MLSLRHILATILPQALHPAIVGAYEAIGDIALITLPTELLPYRGQIGAALLASNARLRVVAGRQPIDGEFRLSELEIIAGEPPLSAIHKENGLRFAVDVEKVYFSARLAGERLRLARLAAKEERILVIGSGVAPLPLTIACHGQAAEIVGVEKNPFAHLLAVENLALNRRRLVAETRLVNADYRDLAVDDVGSFDRLVIAMPEIAFSALPHCLPFIRPGGFLHLYAFQDANRSLPAEDAAAILAAGGRRAMPLAAVRCGHCGRSRFRLCLEARVE